jgi:hypothetical protein
MAALFFNTRQMVLGDAVQDIGEWKNLIANVLKESGFIDVVNTPAEVAGNQGATRLSVLHLLSEAGASLKSSWRVGRRVMSP